ncbi:4Fe-4S dicluster domain-containing protein [Planctomycetota bacterium]
MRWPKLRELKEAVTAVFSPRFTTRFPAVPCEVPDRYRGKPKFNDDTCVGCGACVNVCPTLALTQKDDLNSDPPNRRLTLRYDTCIFCGHCAENCTTQDGIQLSQEWDLAGLDRSAMVEHHDHALQCCEKCGAVVGTHKHLVWLSKRLGPLAYTNPSLLLAQVPAKASIGVNTGHYETEAKPRDFMRILCPECKCQLNLTL